MPSMADIIVKKADETTNITYSQVVPSAGDRSPALWKCTSIGSAPGHNPSFKSSSRTNGDGTGRRVDFNFAYPQTATASDGSISIVNVFRFEVSAIVPLGMPQTTIDEAAAQACNLVASTLVKSVIKSGYSPT